MQQHFNHTKETCNVHKDNPFLFGRPQCPPRSHYRGQDCIHIFAHTCGAKNPDNLRSTQLRKHIATMSQIPNLKNNELDQLANFLGHDIRVHRDFYRLPEANYRNGKKSQSFYLQWKKELLQNSRESLLTRLRLKVSGGNNTLNNVRCTNLKQH